MFKNKIVVFCLGLMMFLFYLKSEQFCNFAKDQTTSKKED